MVGFWELAPLTRRRGGPLSDDRHVSHCAATAFVVKATAHAVFLEFLAVQRHTAILHHIFETCCHSLPFDTDRSTAATRRFTVPIWRCPADGGICGAPVSGRAPRAYRTATGGISGPQSPHLGFEIVVALGHPLLCRCDLTQLVGVDRSARLQALPQTM